MTIATFLTNPLLEAGLLQIRLNQRGYVDRATCFRKYKSTSSLFEDSIEISKLRSKEFNSYTDN